MIIRYLNIKTYIVVLALVFISTGCIEDKCTAVLCKNEGVCVDGRCACAFGYEGDSCQKQWYEKFSGTWTMAETNKTNAAERQYQVNAIYGKSPDTFFVLGFADTLDTIVCIRKAYTTFTILPEKWAGGDSIKGGEATLYNETNKVTGLYSFVKGDVVTNVTFTWTR